MAEMDTIDNYAMPPLDVRTIDPQGMTNLIEAIITRACSDYVVVCRELVGFRMMKDRYRKGVEDVIRRSVSEKMELQGFFRSGWFSALAGPAIDGEKAMEVLEFDTPWKYLNADERRYVEDAKKRGETVKAYAGFLSEISGETSNAGTEEAPGESEMGPGQGGSGDVHGGEAPAGRKSKKCPVQGEDLHAGGSDGTLGRLAGHQKPGRKNGKGDPRNCFCAAVRESTGDPRD